MATCALHAQVTFNITGSNASTNAFLGMNQTFTGNNTFTAGTRTFSHDSTHTLITNTATLTSSEWTAGSQKEWYNGNVTMTIDKTNGSITAKTFIPNVKTTTTNYTASATDSIIFVTGTNVTITLLDATNATTQAGRMLSVMGANVNGGTTIVTNANGVQTVLGALSISFTATNRATFITDGANWW